MAIAPRASKRAEAFRHDENVLLPAGRYLVKLYIDRQDKTKVDRNYELSEGDLAGQIEIDGDWPPGYQPPKSVQYPSH